ncbi:acyltransferase family protein [Curtobacterium sp. VKM Ac-2922]|uniref:acyltransferase family protein n=1 Tax=Curtobacterium sp. VKM Ac-2922 TaxID=2929475 RepID=UPI001FB1C8C9|nr:acyltransferase family protein [Curtobacterium sp. VKM Ac-2922]MCJ1714076.1 acyltransferase [Curtobacterium sp. VKM Ac-2922]
MTRSPAVPDPAPAPIRTDIQVLRALAAALVVGYHAHAVFLRGGFVGVDVFFVISGYVVAVTLVRERAATGGIDVLAFARRRVERLLPAAVVVVAATLLVARARLPLLDFPATLWDGVASLLGVENLVLTGRGTDYLAGEQIGLFEQFWSLGVETQFFVALPVVLLAVRTRAGSIVVLSLLVVASFVVGTVTAPDVAYLSPTTRAWEFGVGVLIAVIAAGRAVPVPRPVGAGLRVVGLGAVLGAAVLVDESAPFPVPWAVVPVLGAALLVVPLRPLRTTRRAGSVPRSGVLRLLGDMSYSVYLWHWPVLAFPEVARSVPLAGLELAAALTAVLVVSWATFVVVETRFRRWLTRRSPGLVAGVCVGMVGVVVASATVALPGRLADPRQIPAPTARDVLAGPHGSAVVPANARPGLAQASADLPSVYADGCVTPLTAGADDVRTCSFGSRRGSAGTVVLFGDSHAAQWASPLRRIAHDRGLRLVVLVRAACPPMDFAVVNAQLRRRYAACEGWRRRALDRIEQIRPQQVVIGEATSRYVGQQVAHTSFAAAWSAGARRTLDRMGTARVSVLQDTPSWSAPPNACLSDHVDAAERCASPRDAVLDAASRRRVSRLRDDHPHVDVVDPVPWVCGTSCSPVLWNVVVYRDASHLTDAVARLLRPQLDAALPVEL